MDDDLLFDPTDDPVIESTWVTHFSRSGEDVWAHIVRVSGEEQRDWSETMLDERVSDPAGDFQVYIDAKTGEDIAVTLRWGPEGPPVCHRDLQEDVLGSPTLTASHVARLSFRFTGTLWRTEYRPTTWEPMNKAWWLGPEFNADFERARRHR